MAKIIKIEQQTLAIKNKKRVAAYARVSVESERMNHSLSAQISYYSALIQKNPEWEYAGVYADDGISGTGTAKRDEFRRMVADAEQGAIDIILTKSIQRFARNTVDLLVTVRHLKELGVEVRFEKENISSMSGDGELMLTILASFAQEESRSISENVKWGTRKRFEKGIPNGRFHIFGYRWKGDKLVIHPEEAAIVRLIFDNFMAGLSAETTEKQLAEMGVKSYKGKHFSNMSIRQILSNITYTGNLLFQKEYTVDPITGKSKKNQGELPQYFVEGTHEAIIPMEVYEAVQNERMRRRELGVFANWSINTSFLTSKIKCPYCQRSYMRTKHKVNGNTKEYWVCGTRKEKRIGDGCPVGGTINHRNLIRICTEVLGLEEMDEQVFQERIDHIEVPKRYTLTFFMKNGSTITRECPNTGHKDCWTEDYRVKCSKSRMGINRNPKTHNPFTGYLRCPACGANFRRQTRKYKDGTLHISWHCPNSTTCKNAAKPNDETIKRFAAEALGASEFDEAVFHEGVDHIDLTGTYEATIFLKDGSTVVKTWEKMPKKSYPRSEENKEKMRQYMQERWNEPGFRENMSEKMKAVRRERYWSSVKK